LSNHVFIMTMFRNSGITKKQQVSEQQKCTKNDRKKAKAHGEKFPYQKAGRQSRGKESSIGGCLVHLNGTFCFVFLL